MELLDFVDNQDNVLGQASREEIYAKKLPHRIAHILVFNDLGEVALQLRSQHVALPSHWSTSVGGHVDAGESYLQAALRELQEELFDGHPPIQSVELQELGKQVFYTTNGLTKFLQTYTLTNNGPFSWPERETERVEFFSLQKIQQMVSAGEKMHPELIFILEKYSEQLSQ